MKNMKLREGADYIEKGNIRHIYSAEEQQRLQGMKAHIGMVPPKEEEKQSREPAKRIGKYGRDTCPI